MKYFSFLFLFIILVPILAISAPQNWEIDKIEVREWVYEKDSSFRMPTNTILKFKNGKILETNIVELKLIDVIYSENNIPFILFSGRDCTMCDMATSIYVHSLEKGHFNRPDSNVRYSYPGKVNYYMDGTPLRESRMFYGECLYEKKPVIVWYDKILNERNIWESGVYIIEFKETKVLGQRLSPPLPSINKTMELVKTGKCEELPGIEGTSEP